METTKIRAVLYTGKKYKDGSHPIMIRITQNRKRIYKSVGYSVLPDAWDDDVQQVYEKKPTITKRQESQIIPAKLDSLRERYKYAQVLPNATHINAAIQDVIDEIQGISQKIKVNEERHDLKNIKAKLTAPQENDRNKSFLVFGREYRDNFLKAKSVGTYKRYKTVLAKLEDYAKRDLFFSDVTPQFLRDYEAFLGSKEDKPNKQSTVNANMKAIKAIYFAAIAEQIIPVEKNPFFIYKLKADSKVKKDKLTVEEIIAVEKAELQQGTIIWHVRNFFLFSFYCAGIRARDVLQLKWQNIGADGRLEYHMSKTGQLKSISLMTKALAILKHYKTSKVRPNDYIFPFIETTLDLKNSVILYNHISSCTALINKYLKELARKVGIEKVISTHIARHSFADIARTKKASVYDISKMLGHSSIKITEAYLSTLDIESQDETMKSILDF